jgi:AraC family transcriptional regulator
LRGRAAAVVGAPGGAIFRLAALGREVAASPFHLAHTFRDAVGLPVHQYHLRLRLALALDRLVDPATQIGAVAHALGFASHAHLTTAFRRVYGVAPSAAGGSARALSRPA